MKHLGDITKISGYTAPPVWAISFGSPCQDLSTAGKRAGFKHADLGDEETTRSGLFFEAIRIIKEMRDATANGVERLPRIAIFENVPGALSSHDGEDFKCLLEAFVGLVEQGVSIPRSTDAKGRVEKWKHAGCIVGDSWSIAWRIMDGQFFGCPQRRKRICVLADLNGQAAGEILLSEHWRVTGRADTEQVELGATTRIGSGREVFSVEESVSGNSVESVKTWKGIARCPEDSFGTDGESTEICQTLEAGLGGWQQHTYDSF